jgi:hypothetical protein
VRCHRRVITADASDPDTKGMVLSLPPHLLPSGSTWTAQGEPGRGPNTGGATDPTLEPLLRAYAARTSDASGLRDPRTGALDPRRVLEHVQRAVNLPVSGQLDPETMLALILFAQREAPSPSVAPAAFGPAPSRGIPAHRFTNTGDMRPPRLRAAQGNGSPVATPSAPQSGAGRATPAATPGATPTANPTSPTAPGAALAVPNLAQSNGLSCGQTSAAAAINFITGKSLDDRAFNAQYGFSLLGGLNAETKGAGVSWSDAGNLGPQNADAMRAKVQGALAQGLPVVIGLNGPEFSPSGSGHIVTITGLSPDGTVSFMDPNGGRTRTTRWENMVGAPSHPDGNFVFVPSR